MVPSGKSFTQNVVSCNSQGGFYVTAFSANCIISNNIVDGNTFEGIYFDPSGGSQCTVTHNFVDYNGDVGITVAYDPSLGVFNTGNVFSYDEALGNKNYDAVDANPSGSNTWTHDHFGTTNPPGLGK